MGGNIDKQWQAALRQHFRIEREENYPGSVYRLACRRCAEGWLLEVPCSPDETVGLLRHAKSHLVSGLDLLP